MAKSGKETAATFKTHASEGVIEEGCTYTGGIQQDSHFCTEAIREGVTQEVKLELC